jgi:hypothetical protein
MEILCTCQRRADTRRMAEVDAALVLRVLDGDRSAFETLLSMHAIRARRSPARSSATIRRSMMPAGGLRASL